MSESTPIYTPTRTANEVENGFPQNQEPWEETKGIDENNDDENELEARQSYQEWRDTMMEDEKSTASKKSNKKQKKNIELLTGMTPSKILNSARKPVLGQTHSAKTPLNGMRNTKNAKTTKKNGKGKLEKVFSEDPKCDDYDQLAISTGSHERDDMTDLQPYASKNSAMSNFDMIQDVDQNKKDIAAKKQRLKDLEEEIVTISDKMTLYQKETNEIIEDLNERIEEREQINQKIKEEPMFYTLDGSQEVKPQDDYTSEDDLLNMLKNGVDKKFKTFLDSWKGDLKDWKAMVCKEVEAFNEFLQHKHKILQKGKIVLRTFITIYRYGWWNS